MPGDAASRARRDVTAQRDVTAARARGTLLQQTGRALRNLFKQSVDLKCVLKHPFVLPKKYVKALKVLCLQKKHHSAIQQYKLALELDFSRLRPLHEISREYHALHEISRENSALADETRSLGLTELESLTLLVKVSTQGQKGHEESAGL